MMLTVLTVLVDRVECVSEEEAIDAFFAFLEAVGPNVVLVGVDEDTVGVLFFAFCLNYIQVGVLVQKLKARDKAKLWSLVAGYTWWKRVLKHTNMKHK